MYAANYLHNWLNLVEEPTNISHTAETT